MPRPMVRKAVFASASMLLIRRGRAFTPGYLSRGEWEGFAIHDNPYTLSVCTCVRSESISSLLSKLGAMLFAWVCQHLPLSTPPISEFAAAARARCERFTPYLQTTPGCSFNGPHHWTYFRNPFLNSNEAVRWIPRMCKLLVMSDA